LIWIVCFLLLSGCWDRKEINDVAFVVGTAVDLEDGIYRSTVQIPLVGQMGGPEGGGGGSSGSKAWHSESAVGKTFRESMEAQQNHLSRVLHFSHRRVLIISEAIARKGIMPVFDPIFRIPQNRLSTLPIVALDEAKDILVADAPIERMSAEMVRELSQMATVDPINLRIFLYSLLTEGMDPIAPAVRKVTTATNMAEEQKSTIQLAGIAVFRHDKLATVLEDRAAIGLLLAMGQARRPTINVAVPGEQSKTASLQITRFKPDIQPRLKNGRIEVVISLDSTATLVENLSDYDLTDYRRRTELEGAAEQRIAELIEEAVTALQEHKADVLGFGDAVHRRYRRHWARVRERWEETEFPNMEVTIKPQVHIEHNGSIIQSIYQKTKELKP